MAHSVIVRLLLLCVFLVCSSCAVSEDAVTRVQIGEKQYIVPSTHVSSVLREPHQFIRVRPPEREFDLVYDSRLAGRSNQHAFPVIFSVNDEQAPDVEHHTIEGLTVVCRRAVHPQGGCGMKLQHHSVEWAVLFPFARRSEASVIRGRALEALNAYTI